MTPEALARQQIDQQLTQAGWVIQDRKDINLGAALGVAIREFQTTVGPADYLLFVDGQVVGILEAKKAGVQLTGVEAQTADYAKHIPKGLPVPVRPPPFLYESTGAITHFTNGLDPSPRSRPIFNIHQPATLQRWLRKETDRRDGKPGALSAPTLIGRLQLAPPINTAGMWPVQGQAVQNLETSIKEGKPRALVQMATGSGKTFTTISALYRLIKFGGAERVLFLVDRGNLGRQALKEFQSYTTPDDGRKFTELYNVAHLRSNKIDPVNRVVITTIQRLYSILKGEPDFDEGNEERSDFTGSLVDEPPPVVYSPYIPPELFDVVVVDECHRSIYTLWRQALEYFDATMVGLTATPAKHTFAFFNKNVVMEYRHEHAVRDKVNVPYEVYEIRTAITVGGALLAADEPDVTVGKRDRATKAVRWEKLDEDLSYGASQLDRSVVAVDQIRTVVREFKDHLFTDIFPGRTEIPKTLIFAKTDDHAEDILKIVREEFNLGNEGAVKVTYKPERTLGDPMKASPSHRPEELIQKFRNSYHPRIAVTVDMIATGTDIKPLECVVFMRTVKSRGLFEQMKGRGVRVINDTDFRQVTPDATTKTHFVIVDCVGVYDEQKTDPPIVRDRTVPFEKLLEMVRAGNRDEDVLSTLAGRLDRIERKLTEDQKAELDKVSGGAGLHAVVAGLFNALDPDVEDARARQMFQLSTNTVPSQAQVLEAQKALRDEAAQVLAHNPALCATVLAVRKQQDQTIDHLSQDEVLRSGFSEEHRPDYDRELVDSFQAFIEANKDEIAALQVMYSRPYAQRLTRRQIKELADAIGKPPRQWTPDALWGAYERLDKARVRGAGSQRMWTDIVSLARFALKQEPQLVPFAERVKDRFQHWLLQQQNQGRKFTPDQMMWLEMIRDRIAEDAEVAMDDFDDVPFNQRGGLGRLYGLFGDALRPLVEELNKELVA